MAWVSPVGASGVGWINRENAYDENVETETSFSVPPKEWGGPLKLNLGYPIYCNKIRYYFTLPPTYITQIDIDVYYDGDWHHVYDGSYVEDTWLEYSIPAGTKLVSSTRVKGYNNYTGGSRAFRVGEADFWEVEVTAPTITTIAANNVEETTANPRGNVTATGEENPTRYIDYDTDSGAPYANSKNCGVGGTGEYNSNLIGLSPGQKYYYRARAVNSGGTGTGSEMTFTTKPNPPTALSATVVSSTQIDVAWTKGTGAEKTMVRRKVGSYPTSVSDGDQAYFDTGNSFSDTGLDPGKHYYYRAWSYKTGAPNAGYSDEYAQDDGETPYPHSYGFIIG